MLRLLNSNQLEIYIGNSAEEFEITFIKNGKNHGKLYAYTDNGQLIDVGEWKNGIKDGESKNYYEDGQLMNIQIFKKD